MRALILAGASGPSFGYPSYRGLASRARVALVLALSVIFLFASAMSLGPAEVRGEAGAPTTVCHCAHCPGGAACCCRGLAPCAIHH